MKEVLYYLRFTNGIQFIPHDHLDLKVPSLFETRTYVP